MNGRDIVVPGFLPESVGDSQSLSKPLIKVKAMFSGIMGLRPFP